MVQKTTKKKPIKKRVTKQSAKSKQITKKNEDNSMGIMFLAGIGLILLIYFGSTINVEVDVQQENTKPELEMVEEAIVISGKTYSSKMSAKKALTNIPQSQLTNEEINFVEGYQN